MAAANPSTSKMPDQEVVSELDLGAPSADLLEWAKKNIREDPNRKYEILEEFRDMIYSRGECTPHRTDDAFLLRFLRARNFSMDGAYQLFVNYYDFKEENPELSEGVKLSVLDAAGKSDFITVPPYKDQSGRRMVLFKFGNWNPEVLSMEDTLRASLLIIELASLEESQQILGGRAIFDMGNISLQQAWHMTPSYAKKIVQIMVTTFPLKIASVHVVNQSWLFDTLYNIFKPFLHPRMSEKIYFHGNNMESLHEHIDPKYLPDMYGGVHPKYDYKEWIEGFRKNEKIIQELEPSGYVIRKDDGDYKSRA